MTQVAVYLLGRFAVYRNGHTVSAAEWQVGTNKTLLKALLTAPGYTFSVDTLVEYLWPGSDPEFAVSNLRGRISQVRRILEPTLGSGHQGQKSSFIKTTRGGYAFDPTQAWIDTEQFTAHIQHAQAHRDQGDVERAIASYRAAIDLYDGDFLPEDNNLDWVLTVRDELRRQYLHALTECIDLLVQEERDPEAMALCETGIDVDPYNEHLHRILMRCYHRQGNVSKAITVYEVWRHRLRTVLGVEPASATQKLYAQIRAEAGSGQTITELERDLAEKQRILATTTDPQERIELLRDLSAVLDQLGQREKQVESLQEAIELARYLNDPNREGDCYCALAECYSKNGEQTAAQSAIDQALRCYTQTENQSGQARAYIIRAAIQYKAGQSTLARQHCEHALQLVSDGGYQAERIRCDAYALLGHIAYRQGDHEEGLDLLDKAYRASYKLHDAATQARLLMRMGSIHYSQDRLAEARIHWNLGRDKAHQAADYSTECKCLNNLAILLRKYEQPEDALTLYQQVLSLMEDLEDTKVLADVWNNIGTINERIGRLETAYNAYEQSLHYSHVMGDDLGVAMERINIAGIQTMWGQFPSAKELLDAAFPVMEESGDCWWIFQGLLQYGWLYQKQGDYATAREYMERAVACAHDCDYDRLYVEAMVYLAFNTLKAGHPDRARQQAEHLMTALNTAPPGYYLAVVNHYLSLVLDAFHAPTEAQQYREQAYTHLMAFARQLGDSELRASFFADPLHRAILEVQPRSDVS